MVIVHLNGGLGNQLFQYAAARALSLHHQVPLLLDISSFYRTELPELEVPRAFELYHFQGVTEATITKDAIENNPEYAFARPKLKDRFLPRYKRGVYAEPFYHFDSNFYKANKDVYLKGGWQSEKYFVRYRNEISDILQLKEETISGVKQKALELSKENVIGVHIRRGDYLRKPVILEWHGVLGKDYYSAALDIFAKKFAHFKLAYFTDDIGWVERELLPIAPGEIISNNISRNALEDFYLMSHCAHNIIGNSTFSWWAAWLNKNPEKMVIAPKKWFNNAPSDTKDLIPDSWIRI